MSIGKKHKLRGLGLVAMAVLLLGLILACSLFNQAPVARIVADVLTGNSPLVVSFHGTDSVDADGTISTYVWDFGDGDTDTGPTVQHTFTTLSAIETFEVTLTITDDDGSSSQATQTIEVRTDGPSDQGTGVPTARFTASTIIGVDPLTVTFDASQSTAGTGTIAAYNWNFGDGETATGAEVTHTYSPDPEQTTTYPATLFVWNSNDQVDTAQQDIIVIVPEVDDDDDPEAEIFVTGPDLVYESDNPASVPSLFEVKLDPRGSSADAGHSLEYFVWNFGDGDLLVETSDLEVTHMYALSAPSHTYVASLTVFDDSGLEHTAIVNITLIQE
ncbi:PKD domain-containing protein, partial [Candidatus Bipolaricaulota bacterium]